MVNKRVIVDPPPFSPLQFGLLSVASDRSPDAPDKWNAGITWQSHCPESADGTYDPCLTVTRDEVETTEVATPGDPPNKDATTEFFLRGATPFTIYGRFDCSPVGFWDRAQDMAVEAINRVENYEVERIFDSGVAPREAGSDETVYPHLRATESLIDNTDATLQPLTEVVDSTPMGLVEAMGRLQAALAECYHGRGVLHVPSILSSELAFKDLVSRRNDQLVTLAGNRVALGSGYSGASPDGTESDDVAWIYATGAVFYYRSEVRVGTLVNMFDRSTNTVEALAERTYVIGWDCCLLGIPVLIDSINGGAS